MFEEKYITSNAPNEDRSGAIFLESDGNNVNFEKILLTDGEVEKVAKRLTNNICNLMKVFHDIVLVGIEAKGKPLAEWIVNNIMQKKGLEIPLGCLDINIYRDDLKDKDDKKTKSTILPFSVDGKGVVLIDDVIHTGRTVRAALDALVDFGRPAFVKLAVLVDRGGREIPIQPDYVGLNVKPGSSQIVEVQIGLKKDKNKIFLKGEHNE